MEDEDLYGENVDIMDDDDTGATGALSLVAANGASTGSPLSQMMQSVLQGQVQAQENYVKAAQDYSQLYATGIQKLLESSRGPSKAEMLLGLSAQLARPTRTGGFGETLGNAAGYLGQYASQRRQADAERRKTLLEANMQLGRLGLDTAKSDIDRRTKMADLVLKYGQGQERNAAITEAARIRANAAGARAQNPAPKQQWRSLGATPDGRSIVQQNTITGETRVSALPKGAQLQKPAKLSGTEQSELINAETLINAGMGAISNLEQAIKLSPTAYEGRTAGAREAVAGWIPGLSKSDGQTATAELENIILENALTQLKATFGGAPTEGERAILLQLQGSVNMTHEARTKIWQRAIDMAKRRIELNRQIAKRLKSGFYSDRGNYSSLNDPADVVDVDPSEL